MSSAIKDIKRVTTHTLQDMKQKGVPIAMITAYDFSMARLLDGAGVDVILVGDSASNVMAGHETTLPITLDQMIEEMVQAGHAPPEFKATPHSFTVILSNKRERTVSPKWTRSMNERQTRAVNFVRESGSITNREYRQLCPDVSPETLRLDLADLVDRGVLLKIGSKKGTYYILK